MNKFAYLVLAFFALTLASCGDINEFTPTVQSPDAEWKVSYVTSLMGSPTTTIQSTPEEFKAVVNSSAKTITLNHTFYDDSRAWFSNNPEVKMISTVRGPQIEITYKQISETSNSLPNQLSAFPWTHTFAFADMGRGATAKIPVIVRRTYTNSALFGFDKVDNERLIP